MFNLPLPVPTRREISPEINSAKDEVNQKKSKNLKNLKRGNTDIASPNQRHSSVKKSKTTYRIKSKKFNTMKPSSHEASLPTESEQINPCGRSSPLITSEEERALARLKWKLRLEQLDAQLADYQDPNLSTTLWAEDAAERTTSLNAPGIANSSEEIPSLPKMMPQAILEVPPEIIPHTYFDNLLKSLNIPSNALNISLSTTSTSCILPIRTGFLHPNSEETKQIWINYTVVHPSNL